MKPGITVAIPAIPPRADAGLLERACRSASVQTLPPTGGIAVSLDADREGAAVNRQRALDMVETEWTAFLDDDDEFLAQHLERLYAHALLTGADYVYSGFIIPESPDFDPLGNFGRPWSNDDPVQTTITVLVRTELAQSVGFLRPSEGDLVGGQVWGEDYQWTLGCMRAGATIVHLPEKTWYWHHHGYGQPGVPGNTSGRPDRW